MEPNRRARHVERQARPRATKRSPRANTPALPGEATRKPADERWRQILAVSARMFAERGYAATSLQQIADELNLLKGSLYYYINTKEDLLYEVIRSVYWEGVANFQQMSKGEGTAMTRLQAAIEGHVTHLISNMTATTVYLHEFTQMSKTRQDELSSLDYTGLMRDLIKEGQADKSIREDLDPRLAAMAILGATNWVYRWYRPGQSTPAEIAAQFAEIFTSGLSATQTAQQLTGTGGTTLPGQRDSAR